MVAPRLQEYLPVPSLMHKRNCLFIIKSILDTGTDASSSTHHARY